MPSTLRIATGLLLLPLFVGCGASGGRGGVASPTRPSVQVLVQGEELDLLGVEVGRDGSGQHVQVELSDGRTLWVPAEQVAPEALAAGAVVAVQVGDEAILRTASVVDRRGDLLLLAPLGEGGEPEGTRFLVSIARVVARLHESAPSAPTAPAADPAREVAWRHAEVWAAAWVVGCGDDGVGVMYRDGGSESVAVEDIAEIRLEQGDECAAYYQGGRTSYDGEVLEAEPGRYHLRYSDGDQEWVTDEHLAYLVRPIEGSTPLPRAEEQAICGSREERHRVLVRRWVLHETGTLVRCEASGEAAVRTRSGAPVMLTVAEMTPLASMVVGASGRARYHGQGRFLGAFAEVAAGRVHVEFEDGDRDQVPLTDVLTVLSPVRGLTPPAPLGQCPGPLDQT